MLISVLMCVKNGEDYLEETIKSILNQSYSNFEFVIVVNCSTDDSLNIIKKFDDERIKVFETNICQLSFNLNYGLELSKGEYIVRIDADDIAKPDRLKKQLSHIKKGFDVVGSNVDYIDENSNYFRTIKYPELNKEIRNKIYYKSVIAHPSVMFKKDVVLNNGGYLGGKYAQDYDLWLRLMRDDNLKFYNIQESLTNYRVHSNQSKGNKLSYANVSGYLLKESIYSKSIKYFIGSVIYYLKGLIK